MNKGLGKGLGALISDIQEEEQLLEIDISMLRPNPYQPRKQFDQEMLEELANSMQQYGIVQPLVVRESIHGFEIVAGERRFRAAKIAHFKKVPAIIRTCDDGQMMEIGLLENLQREDLNPIEIATAYQKLMEHLSYTQEELAHRVGKSRPHVANFLRLLQLPIEIQENVSRGTLSMGHARALLAVKQPDVQKKLANRVIKEKISVRELEAWIQRLEMKENKQKTKSKQVQVSPTIKRYEDILQQVFHTPVKIKQGRRRGKIEIEYYSEQELERLIELFHQDQVIE